MIRRFLLVYKYAKEYSSTLYKLQMLYKKIATIMGFHDAYETFTSFTFFR